ncbi:MAG: endopeptidase La [Polyangiaceae bacterium]|nr:endopeptidase La [Polyangiaceae bacterium]
MGILNGDGRRARRESEPGTGPSLAEPLPVLPLTDAVIFPETLATIHLSDSSEMLADVLEPGRHVALLALREGKRLVRSNEDVYQIGALARIHAAMRQPDGVFHVAVQGLSRIRLIEIVTWDPFVLARVERAPEIEEGGLEAEGLARAVNDLFAHLVAMDTDLPDELVGASHMFRRPLQLANFIASVSSLPKTRRQELLEIDSTVAKLHRLIDILQHELAVRELSHKIRDQTKVQIERAQREHILRQHMESIQKELGEGEPDENEARELRERIEMLELPDDVRKEVERELARLSRTPSASPEHGMVRTYLDWIVKLPWGKWTGKAIELDLAREILDQDHYNLDTVKTRIVEHLAVKRLRQERYGGIETNSPGTEPILCFVGPPGVGKTSLGQSIARALRREFARVSLGGTHDEAEIRGHRKTYIASMPGRIIQAISRAGAADPVFMLDEIDKLGSGYQGDPAAALLEVLDPAQNNTFVDHYLGVPFDLSRVMFICTANTIDPIPRALLDRMEVLELAGYTDAEKVFIAERFLIPRQLSANGLRKDEATLDPDLIRRVVREYTREAGVRNLERQIGAVMRKVALRIGHGEKGPIHVGEEHLEEYLGPQRFYSEIAERLDRPGVATGLAWTSSGGGDILFVEATMMPSDEERLVLTGMLGDVMRESAQAALSYLRTSASRFGIPDHVLAHKVVHIHVPVGAVPKDGPSAGVTILTALASMALGKPVRHDVGMTGEITLRGKVLPIGGVKEKILAAHRAGLRTIALPRRNERALDDVADEVRRACEIVLIDSAEDILHLALGVTAERSTTIVEVPELSPQSMH